MSLTFNDVASALVGSEWVFAKTMPEAPHWYTLRKQWRAAVDFDDVVQFIRQNGYRQKFGRAQYTFLDIDGFMYSTTSAPLWETILINRAVIDRPVPYDTAAP